MRLKGCRKELSGVMEIVCILFGILVTWVFLFVVELLSRVCSMPGLLSLTVSGSLPKFMSIESVICICQNSLIWIQCVSLHANFTSLQIKLLHQFVSFYVVSQVQIQSSIADFLMKLRFTSHISFCFARWPSLQFSSVQSLRHVQHFVTPWNAACKASLSITNSGNLLKFMFIESVMPPNHVILCHSLLLPPSIRVFSNESALPIRWPKDWSFRFTLSPSNEYSGLISFRIDWLDLLAVQGTLKSLLQHHSSKASILPCLAYFIVQLSHPYMTTGKSIALTRQTFVGKVMSLLFNMLSRTGRNISWNQDCWEKYQ